MKLGKLVGGALAVAAGAAAGAWTISHIGRVMSDAMAKVLEEATASVGSVIDSLSRLILPVEPHEQVAQQTAEEWDAGDILTPADQFQASLDGDDWTDVAQSQLDPRLSPEIPILPLEDRRVAGFPPVGPGIGQPDLSAEDL